MTNDKNAATETTPGEATLSKSYDPHAIERRIYQSWESHGYFAPAGQGPGYCIVIPPPNVTGSLHMGHAFQDTLMDALIRYHRMKGCNTLWQAGTDHAGIATQMVVERQLEQEGKTRHDLGREAFVERVWQWKHDSGNTITKQLRRMGASLDWSRERFTMDEGLSRAVTEVFVRLHEEGLIYRGKRLVNWDPVLHTAVSDLEVISEEEPGKLWHIRYPIAGDVQGRTNVGRSQHPASRDTGTSLHGAGDRMPHRDVSMPRAQDAQERPPRAAGGGYVVVATTRPETMLGDTAVAVHPEDERYKHLVGKHLELPLTGRQIPVIADEYVDKEFGSGCLKITPAHDFNDYDVGKRHKLPMINIFTIDAHIDLPGSKYHELDRYDARKRIVADLEAQGLLERVQDHKLMVPRGDRSNAVIEPFLTDQWFVNVAPLAAEAIAAVEQGRIKFVPENWSATYYQWMRNIQDWCISRQLWWGHRIPAWYDADGNIYVARSAAEAHAQAKAKLGDDVALDQDHDVLDTWFSSALWPFSTLGWPHQTAELKSFYPTNVLVTGFDIIFFWVARMIMMGLKFMGDVPFREVYIHGLVRDAHGEKMSKSKGNILDPLDLIDGVDLETLVRKRTVGLMRPQDAPKIEKVTRKDFPNGIPAYGTDALRFTFANLATQGRDIKFDLGRIEGYRNFCNKLWNAARYVLMNTDGQDTGQPYQIGAQAPSARLPLLPGEGMRVRETDVSLTAADKWIVTRLHEVAQEVENAVREYRFDLAAQAMYGFIWDEYCSWYLELSKVVLTDSTASTESQRGTRRTLVQVLEAALRLLHPIMPFITEEIWQRVAALAGKHGDTIMRQPYPAVDTKEIDPGARRDMDWVMQVISGIRNVRASNDIAPSKLVPVLFADGASRDHDLLKRNQHYIATLARTESITWLNKGATAPESATVLVGELKVLIPLGSLIDKKAELARLQKEIAKTEKEIVKAKGKLANADFISRAPKNVVEQEQQRVKDFESALTNLATQHAKVAALPD